MPSVTMAEPWINAGDLNNRVTLLRPEYNEFQDEIVGWTAVTKVWAAVNPAAGREVTEGQREVGIMPVGIQIRFRTDLDLRWRIQDREHTYEILGITDVGRWKIQLLLSCQEVL